MELESEPKEANRDSRGFKLGLTSEVGYLINDMTC